MCNNVEGGSKNEKGMQICSCNWGKKVVKSNKKGMKKKRETKQKPK